jgi:hypothetical protein
MVGDFDAIWSLVGTQDSSPIEEAPGFRFRAYLGTSLTGLGSVRDIVPTSATHRGHQNGRALRMKWPV